MTDTRPVSSPLLSLRSRPLFLICLATLPAGLFSFSPPPTSARPGADASPSAGVLKFQ